MKIIDVQGRVWSFSYIEVAAFLSCFSNVETFVIDKFYDVVGVRRDRFCLFLGMLRSIRNSPISIHCQPAACSAESPITGVALPEDQYLLRISPEGRRVLILGLSAALREIEDWEFPILTSCSKEYVQGLIDVLKAAPEKE